MKTELETAFDIPFRVTEKQNEYVISPNSDGDELFKISIRLNSGIRVIMEIMPERHAADMLRRFGNVSADQINEFRKQREYFYSLGATVNIQVNNQETDLSTWIPNWHNFSIRIVFTKTDSEIFEDVAINCALHGFSMMFSLLNIVPVETYADGNKSEKLTNEYERNPHNRKECLKIQGCVCKICGMDFKKMYGDIGAGFIHVHHIEPVSLMGGPKEINPAIDLIPVCPNCHAMLHTHTPPLSPDELRKIINEQKHD